MAKSRFFAVFTACVNDINWKVSRIFFHKLFVQETRAAKRAEFQQPIPTSEFALPVYAHPIPEQTPGPRLAPKPSPVPPAPRYYAYSAPAPLNEVAKRAPAQAYSAPAPSYRIEKRAPSYDSADAPSYRIEKRAPSYSAPQPSYKRAYLAKPESYGIEKRAPAPFWG